MASKAPRDTLEPQTDLKAISAKRDERVVNGSSERTTVFSLAHGFKNVTMRLRRAKKSIIEVAESEECKVPRNLKPCNLKRGERIHIVFVSAMWYREPNTEVHFQKLSKDTTFRTPEYFLSKKKRNFPLLQAISFGLCGVSEG